MMQRAIRFLEKETSIWGPIFLLCTLALSAKSLVPLDLLCIALAGFYLSARFKMRGCLYAWILLAVGAVFKHAFLPKDHLWQLCIEASLGSAFFITALSVEQGAHFLAALQAQMDVKRASLENLEEELAKVQEASQTAQLQSQEKVGTLQKELEELQAEHSSILILNEVLRKTAARHAQQAESLQHRSFELSRQKELLQSEYEQCQKDLHFLSKTDELALQNKQLMKELNAARYDKEQTHLINETLARLYAKESLKAKEVGEEAASFADQLAATRQEVKRIAEPLQERLAAAQTEIETLTFQFEKANTEANDARTQLLKLGEIQAERNFLKERLQAASEELSSLKWQKTEEPVPPETFYNIEPLFKQLKKQFEEKSQVLHETRAQLFKADTELQALRMEKAALDLAPVPKEVESQLGEWGQQVIHLEEENRELQLLITTLMEESNQQKKK